MPRTSLLAFAAAATVLATAAPAQPKKPAAAQQAPKEITRADLVKNLDSRFAAADANHDGSLSVSEIQATQTHDLQAIQARRKAEIEAEFKKLDTNKDNQLSIAEFSAAIPDVRSSETPQQVLQKYDTNHDGKISEAEYRAPQLKEFAAMDFNHDGKITPDEARRAQAQQKR